MNLPQFHLSICGDAKHGKSTLAGRLVAELDGVSQRELQKLESQLSEKSDKVKKLYNKYSMIFLSQAPIQTTEGRVSKSSFPTRGSVEIEGRRLTLIDTPGQQELYWHNIVYGLYLADAAIVVVEASANGVQIGTEQICRVLKAFEVPVVAFCVTKMDQVGFSEDLFQQVTSDIQEKLQQKYALEGVPIVPVSALSPHAEGIVTTMGDQTNRMPWYQEQEPKLLKLLQEAEATKAYSPDAPLRLAVEGRGEIFSPPGAGTVLVGTLEAGTLTPGQEVVAEPAHTLGKPSAGRIRDVFLAKGVTGTTPQRMQEVRERCIVSVSIPDWKRNEAREYLRHGGVLGTKDSPPSVATHIEAEVVFFEEDLVYFGKEYIIQPHVSFTIGTFREILDKESLDLKQATFSAPAGQRVHAVIEFREPWCIETADDFPRLARFAVMEQNRTVAYGRCIRILDGHGTESHSRLWQVHSQDVGSRTF